MHDNNDENDDFVFGGLLYINPIMLFAATLIVIIVIKILEVLFSKIDQLTFDSKFQYNVTAIKTELIYVGVTSFFLTLAYLTQYMQDRPKASQAVAFADILVTLFSLCHCLMVSI